MRKTVIIFYLSTIFFPALIMAQIKDTVNNVPDTNKKFEESKYYSTGYEYYKNKMYLESIEPLKKVIAINPMRMAAYRYLAFSYQKLQEQYQKANNTDLAALYLDSTKMIYYQGLTNDSTYDLFHQMLGFIYLVTGNIDSARTEYTRVVEIDRITPLKDADVRFRIRKILGDIAFKEEDNETALDWYTEAADINPNDAEISKKIEEIAKGMGDQDLVIEKIKVQLNLKPADTVLLLKLGRAYMKNSQFDSSAATLEKLVLKTPNTITHLLLLGKSYQSMENFNKAITIYKRVLNSDSKDKDALVETAACYSSLNQIENAQNFVCRALSRYPNYNMAIWLKGELIEKIASFKLDKNGNISYEGKFIYESALETFKRLGNDPQMGKNANSRVKYLQQFIRTKEDKFMHKNEVEPKFDFGC